MSGKEKVYIAGKIAGLPDYKKKFALAQEKLQREGCAVLNPTILPSGFTDPECLHICFAMIDVCDRVYFLANWKDSVGAKMEYDYAVKTGKKVTFDDWVEKGNTFAGGKPTFTPPHMDCTDEWQAEGPANG